MQTRGAKKKRGKDEDKSKLAARTYLLSIWKGIETESDFANKTWAPAL